MEISDYDQAAEAYMNANQPAASDEETTAQPEATEQTEEQSSNPVNNEEAPAKEQPQVAGWNPQDFAFKADGQVRTAKSKEELLQLASLGYHYNIRAQKLNQKEAELYQREQALQSASKEPEPEEEFNPFAPVQQPSDEIRQKIAELEQQLSSFTKEHEEKQVSANEQQIENFASELMTTYGLAKEDIDEFLWQAMQKADSFEDIDQLKAYFFVTHPDAIESRIEREKKAATAAELGKFKKGLSQNTLANGKSSGAVPTNKQATNTDYDAALAAAMKDPRISDMRGRNL
jgi:hypothetical protein